MNPELREELAYCAPRGIPHSVFRSWLPDDQDKALAYERQMRTVCGSCGTRKSEWDRDKNAYLGYIEICEGCVRLEEERDNVPKDTRGARVGLVPYDRGIELMMNGEGFGR